MGQKQPELLSSEFGAMDRYDKAKQHILDFLRLKLPSTLYYHSYNHVLDVLNATELYLEREGVAQGDAELLRIAALFHDSGFTIDSKEHEKLGCELARMKLPDFGFDKEEIERICAMIMATKYPQTPHNLLEEIICDADLDYLGRDDFFEIGGELLKELNKSGRFKTEKDWNQFQEKFLSSHRYFTESARMLRQTKKLEHLEKIRQSLKD